jgi:hypothetical protein
MMLPFVAFHFGSGHLTLHTQALRFTKSSAKLVRPCGPRKPAHPGDSQGNLILGVPKKNQQNMARPTGRHRSTSTAKKDTTALMTLISGGDVLVGRQKKQEPQLKLPFEDGVFPTRLQSIFR